MNYKIVLHLDCNLCHALEITYIKEYIKIIYSYVTKE